MSEREGVVWRKRPSEEGEKEAEPEERPALGGRRGGVRSQLRRQALAQRRSFRGFFSRLRCLRVRVAASWVTWCRQVSSLS
jgi:hypothetical protein